MLISARKHDRAFDSILVAGNRVEVVCEFKLLGIVIDQNLSFIAHVNDLKKRVNTRLYSIRKIFYLSERVRLQFFKSFILPIFDYCSSLFVYFNKTVLHSLENFFNVCLFRLLNLDIKYLSLSDQFILLSKFNLLPLRVRLFYRVNFLVYNLMNKRTLSFLYNSLKFRRIAHMRRPPIVTVPCIKPIFQRLSFRLFLPSFVNKCMRDSYNLNFKDFGSSLKQNLLLLFNVFEKEFL